LRLLRIVLLPALCFLLLFNVSALMVAQSPPATPVKFHIDAQRLQADLEKLGEIGRDSLNFQSPQKKSCRTMLAQLGAAHALVEP
jgi:hypothetical protein